MSKRLASKYKINRRLGVNLWGRPKSPVNKREYGPGQHGQRRRKPSDFGIQLQAKHLGIIAVAVGKHQNLIANVAILAPSVHDEHVIDRHAGNRVNALTQQFIGMLDKTRKMIHRTGWRECARHGNQDYLFSAKQFIR